MVIYVNPSSLNSDDNNSSSDDIISFEEFERNTDRHREEVRNMCYELARMLMEIGDNHDWTKKAKPKDAYESFIYSRTHNGEFPKHDKWHKFHTENERHHLTSHCPDDVNMLDVLEYISDCCCAGMARARKVHDISLPTELLEKAFKNTVKLAKSKIRVTRK